MQMGKKVKLLKPQGTYLHIAPEDPLGPPFMNVKFFLPKLFFKAFAVPSLNEKRPLPNFRVGGFNKKNYWQGKQSEHTWKPYTDGQLAGYRPVNMKWWTRSGSTDGTTISKSYSR